MKKRILFYYNNYCGETSHGGTEVATYRIAKALKESDKWEVYNAFLGSEPLTADSLYTKIISLKQSSAPLADTMSNFIIDNNIDVVVNMGRFFRQNMLSSAVRKSGRDVKLIFMQHFAPGSEGIKTTFSSGWHLLKLNLSNPLYWLRCTFYPLIKLPRQWKWKKTYRAAYESSNAVVLLSEGYKDEYAKLGKFDNKDKFFAIPNIYEKPSIEISANKEKRVLVLSRMDEIQKRISLALRIWKIIEENSALDEWQLDIVGDGHDMKAVRKLAKKLRLKRVNFHGWQNAVPFLERSSILMSTSLYEGLPLSFIEAQSYGCVPIAFNSYASLKDVVEDEVDGIMIEEFGDCADFASKLSHIMEDNELRDKLSKTAETKSLCFSASRVASLWNSMLQSI